MNMAGKVVVVTGASMGIGEAIVHRFLGEGASVVLASRDLARVEAARARTGAPERTLAVACDVTVREQIERLVSEALARFGRIDVWVNNAGFGLVDSVERMDMAACRRLFDTNLFGALDCMQVVSPLLKQQRSGAIINISSLAGLVTVPYSAAYGASKHALNCASRAARLELAPYGVQVNLVCPGYVKTDFGDHAVWGTEALRFRGALKHGITAEQVAEATWRAYRDNRREVVVPWRGNLLVWVFRLLPGVFHWGLMQGLRRVTRTKAKSAK